MLRYYHIGGKKRSDSLKAASEGKNMCGSNALPGLRTKAAGDQACVIFFWRMRIGMFKFPLKLLFEDAKCAKLPGAAV